MDIQMIVVLTLTTGAVLYVCSLILRKTKSFAPKDSCGADCGCEAKSKNT